MTRQERTAARVAASLPAGWIVCPNCDGYGEYVEGSISGPIGGPVTCWRCKGQGAVRG